MSSGLDQKTKARIAIMALDLWASGEERWDDESYTDPDFEWHFDDVAQLQQFIDVWRDVIVVTEQKIVDLIIGITPMDDLIEAATWVPTDLQGQ